MGTRAIGTIGTSIAGVVLCGVLEACTTGSSGPTRPPTTIASKPTSASPSSPAATSGSPSSRPSPTRTPAALPSGRPGEVHDIVTGLAVPWSIAVLPDGSALVSLRDEARIVRVTRRGTTTTLRATGPDGTVPGVSPGGEGGLLGLTVSPRFATDRLVYAYATRADDNAVLVMKLTGNSLGAARVLVEGIPNSVNHNGGRIKFGPDGMLYIGTGDAGNRPAAQSRNTLNGKILRVTPDGQPAPGNPFGNRVWSYGHRNVQGIGWSADGTMYASEFGQDTWDELNRIVAGANYGWPDVEGRGGGAGFTDPLKVWNPDDASPSGVAVTADAIYLASLKGQRLWRVPLGPSGQVGDPEAFFAGRYGRLRDVVMAPDRTSLWALTSNTFRGEPKPGDDRLIEIALR